MPEPQVASLWHLVLAAGQVNVPDLGKLARDYLPCPAARGTVYHNNLERFAPLGQQVSQAIAKQLWAVAGDDDDGDKRRSHLNNHCSVL
jgi:hypothetical protein